MAARVLTTLAVTLGCLAGCTGGPDDGARTSGAVRVAEAEQEAAAAPDVGAVPIVDTTVPDEAAPANAPQRLAVPELAIEVPVDEVGVDVDGQMQIPEDALRAGWYRYGSPPGMSGDAVIAAHAGSYVTPRGPFFDLREAETGMVIDVEMADGALLRFTIASVEVLGKHDLDLAPYFERDGPPRLVLITCGGQWDETAQSYRSNIIVTARLDDG